MRAQPSFHVALCVCVCSSPPPRFIIIDNGTEFIGENFQRILKDYGIQVHRIHAYTPQENGKIERWWKTIEHSATSPLVEPYLSYIINEYNTKWGTIPLFGTF